MKVFIYILEIIKMLKKILILVSLIFILILGDRLRTHWYGSVPHPGEVADEYNFAWVGLSMIKDGVLIGWTGVKNAYSNYNFEKINVDNLYDKEPSRPPFTLVKPWFDKPPGFALIIGTYSYLKGIRNFAETGAGIIRRPMLKIALLTTLLIFILGYRFYGPVVGLLSALFYSVIPTMVISSRLTLAENGYIPLFLASIIFADLYLKKKKNIYWITAAIFSAIGVFFKLSGISILLSLLLIFALFLPPKNKTKIIVFTLGIGLCGFFAFVLLGAYYDWQTFVKVFFSQSNLFYGAGAEAFFSALVSSKIVADKFLTDGWVTMGFISLIILSISEWKKEKGGTILTIAAISYLIVFLVFGSEPYGWYRFPFFPFLALALARIIQKLFNQDNFFPFLALFLLPFGTTLFRLVGVAGFQPYVFPLRIFLFLTLGLFGLSLIKENYWIKKLRQIWMIFIILLILFLSIKLILFYTYDTWFFVT